MRPHCASVRQCSRQWPLLITTTHNCLFSKANMYMYAHVTFQHAEQQQYICSKQPHLWAKQVFKKSGIRKPHSRLQATILQFLCTHPHTSPQQNYNSISRLIMRKPLAHQAWGGRRASCWHGPQRSLAWSEQA